MLYVAYHKGGKQPIKQQTVDSGNKFITAETIVFDQSNAAASPNKHSRFRLLLSYVLRLFDDASFEL